MYLISLLVLSILSLSLSLSLSIYLLSIYHFYIDLTEFAVSKRKKQVLKVHKLILISNNAEARTRKNNSEFLSFDLLQSLIFKQS